MDPVTQYILFMPFVVLAILLWGGAVYSLIKGFQHRIPGQWTIPLFSTNDRYISAEGIVWRRRFFFCAFGFAALVLAMMIVGGLVLGNTTA